MKTAYQQVVTAEMPEFRSQISGSERYGIPLHYRFHLNVEAGMLKCAAHLAEPDPVRIEAGASHEFRFPPSGGNPHVVQTPAEMVSKIDLVTGDAVGLQYPAHLGHHLCEIVAAYVLENGLREYQIDRRRRYFAV